MKATTLPFNKRVYMLSYIDNRTEARITHARKEIEIIIEEHVSSNKRKSLSNLTKQQYEGLKLLRERVRKNEIVNYTTDKTGRMCVDSPSNYIECMQVHLENTEKVPEVLYREIENTINCHLRAW